MHNLVIESPYPFSEDSDFKKILLWTIDYVRNEFKRQGDPETIIVSSPTVYYKVTTGELTMDSDIIENCSNKKIKMLITSSLTFLGGDWSTVHKKRNATITKTAMEKNIITIFGEKIPWNQGKSKK